MSDKTKTIQELKDIAAKFVKDRDWNQFHSPKNLSMNIAVEAAELMEKFLWLTPEQSSLEIDKNRQEISDELADVLLGVLCFSNAAGIDISAAFEHKIAEVAKKYPVEKVKGRHEKYNKF